MKKIIAAILVLIMALSLVVCGNETAESKNNEEKEAIQVALSTFSLAIPWQIQTNDTLKEAVADYNGAVELTVANADNNTATQITQIENFIDQKVDILLVDIADWADTSKSDEVFAFDTISAEDMAAIFNK